MKLKPEIILVETGSNNIKNRIAFKLKPAAERMVKKGHPWVFEGSIIKQSSDGEAGDLAIIFDQKKNKFLALGFYDPNSPIRIRLLQFHQSAQIDEAWFEDKIQQAYNLRIPLLQTDTNSYRFIYGENDGFPGLVADVYDQTLVVKLYSAIWFGYLEMLLPILIQKSNCKTAVLRLSRNLINNKSGWSEGQVIYGKLENENITFREHGLRFIANVIKGHKTGYFLDHRHNRKKIGELAKGKTVLDVFAYAGGFSVHALAGGAREVTSVDISKQALEMARQNAALNPHKGKHICRAVDAFEELEMLTKQNKKFDIVVIDPPSFAKSAKEVDKALSQYKRLGELGARLVERKGILFLASCSSRVIADDFFRVSLESISANRSNFKILEKTFHDVDHPIGFPEGAYLKGIYLQKT